MSRFLLSLWVLGAILFSVSTLIILGWPTGKPKVDARVADKEMTQPKQARDAHDQPGRSENRVATATNDVPAVRLEPNAGTSPAPQRNAGQGQQIIGQSARNATAGSNASTPMPAMPPAPPQSSAPSPQVHAVPIAPAPQAQSPQDEAPADRAARSGRAFVLGVAARDSSTRTGVARSFARGRMGAGGESQRVGDRMDLREIA
jgi:hypothetical protein